VLLDKIAGSDRSLRLPFGGFDTAIKQVVIGIRPEHVSIGTGAAGEIPLAVSFAEELGDVTYIHGKLPAGSPVTIRSDKTRYGGKESGSMALDPSGIRLFDPDGRRLRGNGS
jgi:lactose/L-arabinose transport system ATP-binding protein